MLAFAVKPSSGGGRRANIVEQPGPEHSAAKDRGKASSVGKNTDRRQMRRCIPDNHHGRRPAFSQGVPMAGLKAGAPTPQALTVHQKSRVLEVAFSDGAKFRIPFELLRVYSPSAEVQGHGPDQQVLQTGKRDVTLVNLEPVGNYAVKPTFSDGHDSGLFSWDYLYALGQQQQALWARSIERRAAAGVERDAPMAPKAAGHACADHRAPRLALRTCAARVSTAPRLDRRTGAGRRLRVFAHHRPAPRNQSGSTMHMPARSSVKPSAHGSAAPFEFIILEWSAYADGLIDRAAWHRWAEGFAPLPRPTVATVPALAEMPAMMRRRVDRLGRLACQVAYWCQPAAQAPMVFASRYGDAERSLSLMGDLVRGQPLSPTGFGLSVHNAISALYSIARGHTSNTVVVAAGRASAAAALTEAAALLADGAIEVLVVCYDAPLPGSYAAFEDQPSCEYAWAWRVTKPGRPGHDEPAARTVRLTTGEIKTVTGASATTTVWPAGLALLHCIVRKFGAAAQTL